MHDFLKYGFFAYIGSEVPTGYMAQAIHGFVEELVVNDDPEYQVHVCMCIIIM